MQNIPKAPKKNAIRVGSPIVDAVLIVVMVLLCVIFIYPFLNVLSISFSSSPMIASGQVTWYPKGFNLRGYEIVFGQNTIWRAYWNTIQYCVLFTIVNLFCTSTIAYSLTQSDFVLRKPITLILLITMFFSGGTVPNYIVISSLGLMNTIWSLVLPTAVSAYNVFVYRAFFKGISGEIREAALIDGAGDFRILFKIFYPLSKPLFATFGLFAVVGMWNSYFEALLYIKDAARQPIQMVLRTILFQSGAQGGSFADVTNMVNAGTLNPKNVQYACITATIGPVLLIYPFIQKHFTQGMQVGAVKG